MRKSNSTFSTFSCRIVELPVIPGFSRVRSPLRPLFSILHDFDLVFNHGRTKKLGGSVAGLTAPSGAAFFVLAPVEICRVNRFFFLLDFPLVVTAPLFLYLKYSKKGGRGSKAVLHKKPREKICAQLLWEASRCRGEVQAGGSGKNGASAKSKACSRWTAGFARSAMRLGRLAGDHRSMLPLSLPLMT